MVDFKKLLEKSRERKEKGMNINDVYTSNWLKAADLKDEEGHPAKLKLTISDWDVNEFKQSDGSVRKQVALSFHGEEKRLGLNVTNSKMVAAMHGDYMDGWIGKEITLVPAKTMNQSGQLVDCVRIEHETPKRAVVRQNGSTKATPKAAVVKPKAMFDEANPPPRDDFNDEVPF